MFMSSMFRRFLGLGVVRRLGAWAGNPSSGLPGGAARHNRTQRKGVAFVAVTDRPTNDPRPIFKQTRQATHPSHHPSHEMTLPPREKRTIGNNVVI